MFRRTQLDLPRRISLLTVGIAVTSVQLPVTLEALPGNAQHIQNTQHTNTSAGSKSKKSWAPALTQNQMSTMLDDVASGKAPSMPARSQQLQRSVVNIARPSLSQSRMAATGNIVRPTMGAGGRTFSPGAHTMGGAGMRSSIDGAKAAQFMQALKAKFGALAPGEGGAGMPGGGMPGMSGMPGMGGLTGAGGHGMPGMSGGGAAGGGMQAQLMQKLFGARGAPGGASMGGPASGLPSPRAAGFGAGPLGASGSTAAQSNSQIVRPQGLGGPGFSLFKPAATTAPQSTPHFAQGSLIKRPPGVSGIAGGANTHQGTSSVSDLERQMEAQYGR